MLIAEGKPEDILRAFHEEDHFVEPVICILASNRVRDAEILKALVENVLEIDSVLTDKVGFVILADGVAKAASAPGLHGFNKVFPALLPVKPKDGARVYHELVRDLGDWPDPDGEVGRMVKKHMRFSEEFCLFCGLNPADMPFAIFAVRGVTEPFAIRLPKSLDKESVSVFFDELSALLNSINLDMSRREMDMSQVAYVVRFANEKEGKIRRLAGECQSQVERSIRHNGVPKELQELLIVQAQSGRLDLNSLSLDQYSSDVGERIKSDQNLLKAERISREISVTRAEIEETLNEQRDLVDKTIEYFRGNEDALDNFQNQIERMSDRLSRNLPGSAMKAVRGIERGEQILELFLRIARRVIGSPT